MSLVVPEWLQYRRRLSTPPSAGGMARRSFLQAALAAGTLSVTGLDWLAGARAAGALGPDERVLVVVLFGGGNDGISMVAPADDGRYQDARGPLAQSPDIAIPLEAGLYWHQNLAGIAQRYRAGEVAVVQGIGDPADDHSHFSSMARWMRGAHDFHPTGFTGWLGRWLDGAGLTPLGGISVGDSGVPLHMQGAAVEATALSPHGNIYGANVEAWEQPGVDALLAMADTTTNSIWADEVADSMATALAAANEVAPIYQGELPEDHGLERNLVLAAEAINLDIGARVLTVEFGDFDTHDDHRSRHDPLMTTFDQAVTAFFNRLDPALADRVTLMTFSEFGRSWTANGSAGIDHGTASTALVMGSAVQGGLYGQMPDLGSFDSQGDLHSTVDFRSYYATILDGWLGGGSGEILGASYENLGIFDIGPPLFGDADCDGSIDTGDARAVLEYQLGLRTEASGCPLTDPASQIHLAHGDFNRDGATDLVDALLGAQCVAGNANSFCPAE